MSSKARRMVFALFVVIIGSLALAPVFFHAKEAKGLVWIAGLCELAVLVTGVYLAASDPPPAASVPRAEPPAAAAEAEPPLRTSTYRGAMPPARLLDPVTKASARRLTVGILGGLAFTAAAVPFAVHLPRWIEIELVVGAWWAIWSVVLAMVAYRGAKLEDDHRAGTGSAVDMSTEEIRPKSVSFLDLISGIGDVEGCAIAACVLLVVGIALLGAWLVVELVAPAVFLVSYRFVIRALAKAHAANTRGDVVRSALSGMGWAAVGTAPLAALVAVVHAVLNVSG